MTNDTLKNMAQEYLQNALQMEARIRQLESQASRTISLEVRRKLRRRINTLHVMVSESRQIAFELEHYYDKPEDKAYEKRQQPAPERKRTKFSSTGYGPPAPAASTRRRSDDKSTISGLRSALSRGNAAKRNCSRI